MQAISPNTAASAPVENNAVDQHQHQHQQQQAIAFSKDLRQVTPVKQGMAELKCPDAPRKMKPKRLTNNINRRPVSRKLINDIMRVESERKNGSMSVRAMMNSLDDVLVTKPVTTKAHPETGSSGGSSPTSSDSSESMDHT